MTNLKQLMLAAVLALAGASVVVPNAAQAGAFKFLGMELNVRLKLVREILLDLFSSKKSRGQGTKIREEAHFIRSEGPRLDRSRSRVARQFHKRTAK